jgi:hypothetical protein
MMLSEAVRHRKLVNVRCLYPWLDELITRRRDNLQEQELLWQEQELL